MTDISLYLNLPVIGDVVLAPLMITWNVSFNSYGMDDQMKRVITEKLPKVSEVNQTDIAEMIGISVDTLRNYKKLTELIPKFVVSYEY